MVGTSPCSDAPCASSVGRESPLRHKEEEEKEEGNANARDDGEANYHKSCSNPYDDLLMVPGGLDKLLALVEESGSSGTREFLANRLFTAQQALANNHTHAITVLTQAVNAQSAAEIEVVALREENRRLRSKLATNSTFATECSSTPGQNSIPRNSNGLVEIVKRDGTHATIARQPNPPAGAYPGEAMMPTPPHAAPPHANVLRRGSHPEVASCVDIERGQQSCGSPQSVIGGEQWFEIKDAHSQLGSGSRVDNSHTDAAVSDVHGAMLPSSPLCVSPGGALDGKAAGVAFESDQSGLARSSWNMPTDLSSVRDRALWQTSARVADVESCGTSPSGGLRAVDFVSTASPSLNRWKSAEAWASPQRTDSMVVESAPIEDRDGDVPRKVKFNVLSRSNSKADSDLSLEDSTPALKAEKGETGSASLFCDVDSMKQKVRATIMKPTYRVSDFYRDDSCWSKIAANAWFEQCTLAVIGLNAIWISIDTDYNKETVLSKADFVFQFGEHFFCSFFVAEWLVRFLAFNVKADMLKDAWCVFDTVLVVFMVLETWIVPIVIVATNSGGAFGGVDPSVLRLLRLLRLTRMARMARLFRAVPELMIMVKGMAAATRSMIVTLVLLTMCIYVFAIAFTQLMDASPSGQTYFSSVPHSMNTLVAYGVIMEDTPDIINDIGSENFLYPFFFMIFVLLASFTILNMLIGVMCETVRLVSMVEHESNLVTYAKARLQKMLLESGIDTDGDQMISQHEFNALLDIPEAVMTLGDLGVDVVGLVELSDFVFEQAAELRFPEFMEIILELRGSNSATVKDVVHLRRFMKQEFNRIQNLLHKMWPDKDRKACLRQSFLQRSKGRQRSTTSGLSLGKCH